MSKNKENNKWAGLAAGTFGGIIIDLLLISLVSAANPKTNGLKGWLFLIVPFLLAIVTGFGVGFYLDKKEEKEFDDELNSL